MQVSLVKALLTNLERCHSTLVEIITGPAALSNSEASLRLGTK